MKTETLKSTECGRCYAFLGAWLRAGEGIGWLSAGTIPNYLYRIPLVYLSLACVFCYSCFFLFVVFCVFVFFFCSHWSLVDVPLISFCPADHVVPDWQPRILLGMVEARSVNVKKTPTTTTTTNCRLCHIFLFCFVYFLFGEDVAFSEYYVLPASDISYFQHAITTSHH